MKRLRAPEHSDAKAANPAAGAPADSTAPQAAADPPAPSSATAPEGSTTPVTELPAGAEKSQPAPEASAGVAPSAEDHQQPSPAPHGDEPASRCNGEASAALHTPAEAGDEQG